MNELVRPLDLKIKGEYILDLEENYFNIKEAVFYLDKKTESMSDEEFSYWIKEMNQNRMFVGTYFDLETDLESPAFWFLKKGNDQLSKGITIIINLLLDANSVLTKVARNVVDDIENYHLAILLFDIKLSSWGLRGDPFLFAELKTFFANHLIPNNCKAFERLLYQECERLIGQRMELNQSVFIERYNKGGMSSGHVDINFWINTIFPKLKEKFKELMPVPKQKTVSKTMEMVIKFKKFDYTDDGTHITSDKFIMELQKEWEEAFHHQFKPYFANVLEGHPSAMQRITKYMEGDEDSSYDFGMELIEGEIDIDTNLAIEAFSEDKTVYAIGSRFHDDEDNPLLLIKNENLSEEILVLKYIADDGETEETETIPVPSEETVKL